MFLTAVGVFASAMMLHLFSLGALFPVSIILIAAAIGSIVAGARLIHNNFSKYQTLRIAFGLLNSSFFLLIGLSFAMGDPIFALAGMVCAAIIYVGSTIILLVPSISGHRVIRVIQQAPSVPHYAPPQHNSARDEMSSAESTTRNNSNSLLITLPPPATITSHPIARLRSIAIIFLFAPILLPIIASVLKGIIIGITHARINSIQEAQITGIVGISSFLLLIAGAWILLYLRNKS